MDKENKIIIILLLVIGLLIGSLNKSAFYFFNNETKNIAIKETIDPMEDYLIGVIACEMPASFNEETLKSQAIASRTYAYFLKSKNIEPTNDTRTQCLITKEKMQSIWKENFDTYYNKIKSAVESTKNLVLKYEGEVIPAYYFSMSNGYTENSASVFSESYPYLQSVSSDYEKENRNFQKEITISKEKFCNKLGIICNDIIISNVKRNSTNRVDSILINEKAFTGIEVRKLLGLRSTDFVIEITENDVNITTYGYGHGVGMSQYGANYLANRGFNYEYILKYYYKDVIISSIN